MKRKRVVRLEVPTIEPRWEVMRPEPKVTPHEWMLKRLREQKFGPRP